MPPRYTKPHEHGAVNKFATNISLDDLPRNEEGKVPLSAVLDPKVRYLYVLGPPLADQQAGDPVFRIGFEYRDGQGRGFGHPTLFGAGEQRQSLIGGELVHYRGQWILNNDSGRWGAGNAAALRAAGLHKKDLIALAAEALASRTDLKVKRGVQLSEHLIKRKVQEQFPFIAAFRIGSEVAGLREADVSEPGVQTAESGPPEPA